MTASEFINSWLRTALLSDLDVAHQVRVDLYQLRLRRLYYLIDEILLSLDASELPFTALVGALTATAACARDLSHREEFYKRVREKLLSSVSHEETQDTLMGLACEEGWHVLKES